MQDVYKRQALCNELKPEGVGYHIHVAEGIYDLHQCLKEHGKRIVAVSYTHLDVYKRQADGATSGGKRHDDQSWNYWILYFQDL